jgi:hypothetical protein
MQRLDVGTTAAWPLFRHIILGKVLEQHVSYFIKVEPCSITAYLPLGELGESKLFKLAAGKKAAVECFSTSTTLQNF